MRHGVIALAAGFLAAGYLVAPTLAQKPQADDTLWLKFDLGSGPIKHLAGVGDC